MMGRLALPAAALSAIALFATAPVPATAQCRLCDESAKPVLAETAAVEIQLEVQASLNFESLIVPGQGDGEAMLRPDGSTIVSGSVAAISGRAMVGSAIVRGEPGRPVRIEMPGAIQLHSLSGATVILTDIVTDLPRSPRLDSAGNLSFRFGGRLKVTAEADGDYRGDVPITVDYL